MYCDSLNSTAWAKTKTWVKIIPVTLTVAAFLMSGCQPFTPEGSDVPGQSTSTGQAFPVSTLKISVTNSADGQNTAQISGIVEGKLNIVSVDAEVSLTKEEAFPIFSALPLDINQDIDQTAWLELAFGADAQRAVKVQEKENPNQEFCYEIPGLKYVGYDMLNAGFLFEDTGFPRSIASAGDLHETQEIPPGCSFTKEEAITKAADILSRYGLGRGFSPLGVAALAYSQDTDGYYAVEFERRLFDLPVFRHTLLNSNTGERLYGDTLSVAVCDRGIIRILGTIHKYDEKEWLPIITLEQAIDIFEKHIDVVRLPRAENGEKAFQRFEMIRLIYMPVPDKGSQKSGANNMRLTEPENERQDRREENIKMVPVWYFSEKTDTQGKSLLIDDRSDLNGMLINAVTGDLIGI